MTHFRKMRPRTTCLELRGVHVAAQLVASKPEFRFEADVDGGISIIRGADSSHEQPALLFVEARKSKPRDYALKS